MIVVFRANAPLKVIYASIRKRRGYLVYEFGTRHCSSSHLMVFHLAIIRSEQNLLQRLVARSVRQDGSHSMCL